MSIFRAHSRPIRGTFVSFASLLFLLHCVMQSLISRLSVLKCSSEAACLMPCSPVRSWDKLYDLLGYPEAEDPESASAIIITTFTAAHQNPVIGRKISM